MRTIISLAVATSLFYSPLSAQDAELRVVEAPTHWNYSTYEDLQRALRSVGQPKYIPRERKILDKAIEVQRLHKALFDSVEVGESIFDYPGLLAKGRIRFDEEIPGKEYILTIGIKPRYAGENYKAPFFTELIIAFNVEGEVVEKTVPRYKW